MIKSGKINSTFLGMLFLTTIGCGSSGPDPEPTPNQAPSVSAENQEGAEGTDITVTATGTDSDGSIAGYAWTQVSGEPVTLTNSDMATVSFTAPAIVEDSDIVLSVTVTDDDGATASASATVTVTANMVDLALEGLVTDGPIANANVMINVGEQEFTTTADETGAYSAQLSLDDSLVQQFVSISATGPGAGSPIKLVSLLGNYDDLVATAGEDGVLTKDEAFDVNVTNVSTAKAALMEDANGDNAITTKAAFDEASKSYNGSLVLPFATAIKLVIDYSTENAGLALPDGISDTSELVSDIEIARSYITAAQSDYSEVYDTARDEVLSDDDVISSGVNESAIPVADSYYFISADGTYGDGRLLLNDDGTGSSIKFDGEVEFNWIASDEGVAISYAGGELVESVTFEYIVDVPEQVEVHTISTGKTIQWLNQSISADQLLIRNTTYRHYPNGEAPDEAPVVSERIRNAVKTAGVLNASDILQLNQVYAFPIPLVNDEVVNAKSEGEIWSQTEFGRSSEKMVFTGNLTEGGSVTVSKLVVDGEGNVTTNDIVMQWSVDNDGHLILVGAKTYDYAFLLLNDGETPYVNVLVEDNGANKASSDHAILKAVSWTNENAPGIYDLPWDFFEPLNYFWVEVNADGSALTISTTDFNENGVLESDEVFQMPGMWQINAKGNLVVRRYRQNSLNQTYDFCTPVEWDPADDASCLLYHEREWNIHQIKETGEYYMNHMHRFFDDPFRAFLQDQNVAGHILAFATSDIRFWKKVGERPVELPAAVQSINPSKLDAGAMRLID